MTCFLGWQKHWLIPIHFTQSRKYQTSIQFLLLHISCWGFEFTWWVTRALCSPCEFKTSPRDVRGTDLFLIPLTPLFFFLFVMSVIFSFPKIGSSCITTCINSASGNENSNEIIINDLIYKVEILAPSLPQAILCLLHMQFLPIWVSQYTQIYAFANQPLVTVWDC